MDRIKNAIRLAMREFKNEHGEDAKLEEGEEFTTLFNDGILIIGCESSKLKVEFKLGEPYKVDYDINILDDIEEE